jgi:uncharacterized membrane protein
MRNQLLNWLRHAWKVFGLSTRRIVWNLFLAYIPLFLSIWLFRKAKSRSLLWWLGFLVFIAFLPNAPYVLTDIIHVIDMTRRGYSVWTITLVVIPQYLLFILAGFEAYVLALINFGYYLHRQGLGRWTWLMELSLHALSAVGIYLGRFKRFNSWDFVSQPTDLARSVVEDLADKRPIVVMGLTFVILVITYWLVKQITLSLIFRWRYQKNIQQLLYQGDDSREGYGRKV